MVERAARASFAEALRKLLSCGCHRRRALGRPAAASEAVINEYSYAGAGTRGLALITQLTFCALLHTITQMSDSTAKISVILDDELYELFDAYCKQKGHKKSTLVAKLIRDHLASEGFAVQSEFGQIRRLPPNEKR